MITETGKNLAFLLGLPRSGTTLLSAMLGKHPAVLCPPEPWIMLAVEAIGEVDSSHPADSQLLGDAVRDFLDGQPRVAAARAYCQSVYNHKLAEASRTFFIDKTPRYHLMLTALREWFPEARFLYLRRNPLDIAASFMTSWQIDIPKALQEDPGNRACIDLLLGPMALERFCTNAGENVLTVSYEQLVSDPEQWVERIVGFLGLDPVAGLTEFDLAGSAHSKSMMGDRKVLDTHSPHQKSINRWAEVFSKEDQQLLLDAIGVDTLRRNGYDAQINMALSAGLVDHGPDTTAAWVRKVEAGLARRLLKVKAASTYHAQNPPLADLEQDMSQLAQNPYVMLTREIEERNAEIEQRKAEVEQRKTELNQRETELDEQRTELERLRINDAELSAAMEREREELQSQLEEKSQEVSSLQVQEAALKKELDNSAKQFKRVAELNQHNSRSIRSLIADASSNGESKSAAPQVHAPDVVVPMGGDRKYRPSWSGFEKYLSAEHAGIWATAKDYPGWQDTQDSEKLYEMGYHSGEVILEIGVFGGRSAAIELTGAIRASIEHNRPLPQFYGIDVDPGAMTRGFDTLRHAQLDSRAVLYHGTLKTFLGDVPIVPTMVFVDGDHSYEGVVADMKLLQGLLAPGTPVLCHDYYGIEGVRKGIDEILQEGYFEPMGQFAGSILLRATSKSTRVPRKLKETTFQQMRIAMTDRYEYLVPRGVPTDKFMTSQDITLIARRELHVPSKVRPGRGQWPEAKPETPDLPPTLPDGTPWPKISVVTPTRNQGKYIEQTIQSVINQDYPNLEYIVMDGASTDNTIEIVNRYRHEISHFISEPDKGQSNAINKGFALATGEIVTWLNSDDMFEPGALAAMAIAFHTSKADMVAGICTIHRDGKVQDRHLTTCANGPLPLADLLDLDGNWMKGQFFYQPEVMFRKSLWDRAGSRVDESLFYSMDYELWLRFAEVGATLHVIGRPIALFRAHEEQKTNDPEKFLAELRPVRESFMARTGFVPGERPAIPTKSQLRIAYFSDLGAVAGAGIAHQRMATAARQATHEVMHLAVAAHLVDPAPKTQDIIDALAAHRPDIVVTGNLHAASLDASVLGEIARHWPTVHVMHDMWAITGRCAYSRDCEKFAEACDSSCPTAGEYPALPPSEIRKHWDMKDAVFTADAAPIIAGVSNWTADMARRRFARSEKKPRITSIRCGIPMEYFKLRDKRLCRELLGLPQDQFIIMFSSSQLSDERKGLPDLLAAMDSLNLPNVMAACVGHIGIEKLPSGLTIQSLGYVDHPQRLAMVYAAADIFVGPSKIETFGQVFVEASACGTPSVAYPVGGVPEALENGFSGILAKEVTPAALAEAIHTLYADADLRARMGVCGRIWAENEWSLESSFQRLYSMLHAQGVLRWMGFVPHISLRSDFLGLLQPTYLIAPPQAETTPAQSADKPIEFGELAAVSAERDELRRALDRLTSTKLWSSIEWARDTFSATIHSRYVPRFLHKGLLRAGRWAAGGLERTGPAGPPPQK